MTQREFSSALADSLCFGTLARLLRKAVECKCRIRDEQERLAELRYIARTQLGVSPKDFNEYMRQFV